MFILLEIKRSHGNVAAKEEENVENDEIFSRRFKLPNKNNHEKYQNKWKQDTKKIHFIKIIGDHVGFNGKFVGFRRNDENYLRNKNNNNNSQIPIIRNNDLKGNSTTGLKNASEINITTDVNNITRNVNKTTGDVNNYNNDRNDVNKEGIDVNNGGKMQYLLETSTTDVNVVSSDFKAKDNAGSTQKISSEYEII